MVDGGSLYPAVRDCGCPIGALTRERDTSSTSMPKDVDLPRKVLDKALELAEASSWEALHLHEVAAALDITLDEIREHYRQKDDLVEAWFDRADSTMLGERASLEFAQLSSRERIQKTIMTWLQALAEHRRITGEMLRYKLELGAHSPAGARDHAGEPHRAVDSRSGDAAVN